MLKEIKIKCVRIICISNLIKYKIALPLTSNQLVGSSYLRVLPGLFDENIHIGCGVHQLLQPCLLDRDCVHRVYPMQDEGLSTVGAEYQSGE